MATGKKLTKKQLREQEERRHERAERTRAWWERMPSEERGARTGLLTGLWEDDDARRRMSLLMSELWDDFKSTARFTELRDAIAKARD